MWKVLFFLACVVSFDVVISSHLDICGTNERYVTCPDTMCIPQNCSQRDLPVPCPVLGPKGTCPGKPGCICVRNYLRDDTTGECIPSKTCKPPATTPAPYTNPTEEPSYPPICKKNEVYYNCSGECTPRRCSEIGYPLNCDQKCTPGCVCKDNYVRADNGTCIPIPDCPSCGGDKNAEQGCSNYCGHTCSTYNKPPPACAYFCIVNGCDCRKGFVYDENIKACVKPEDCTTPQCPVNEVYDPCPPINCPPGKSCAQVCTPTCRCADGLIRCKDGGCAKPGNCQSTTEQCPDSEVYDPCPPINCPPGKACAQVCTPSCRCAVGLIRCKDGRCAKPEKCQDTTEQCPDSEVYDPCPPINCPPGKACAQVCTPTCRCADGLIRCKDGRCAKPENCQTKPPATTPAPTTQPTDKPSYPPICKKNEVYYNCSGGCTPRRCSEIGYQLNCDKKCTPGCVCKEKYVRADNGTCIPIPDCPSCGGDKNAVQGCSNYCGRTCSTYNKPPPPCPFFCIVNGCDCRKGYVYDNNVKACVKPEDCTPTCKVNEEYSSCVNGGCGPKNCSQVGQPDICVDPLTCIKGCVCVKGYLRVSNGTCVPTNQCPPASPCPKNEVYDPCPPINCPPEKSCAQVCTPTCRCADGLIRCKDGRCAKPVNCQTKPPATTPAPPTQPTDKPSYPPICKKNEVYYNCSGECTPRRCSEIGYPLNCDEKCTPGCVCKENYVRADNGTCIPIPDCPSCGGDKNAQQGCSNYCGHTCSTYNKPPPFCPLFCLVNGCDCRKGFVYDNNVKACVKPEDCTPTCKVNEEYSSCINGGCGPKNCSQVGQPDICVDPLTCIKGCVCVKGYLRASNGACVPTDQCPPPPQCPDNEVYDPCPPINCPPGKACAQVCTPTCRCADGLIRCKDGRCVEPENCHTTPPQCPNNEVYDPCPPINCPPGKACAQVCTPTCRCADGLIRCKDGRCAKPENCHTKPPVTTPAPSTEPTEKPSYPPICKKNEVYYNCSGECTPRRCSEIGYQLNCDEKCTPGCVCKDNYVRADNGTCIPIPDCPSCAGDKNAVQGCSNYCGHTCSTYNKPPTGCPQFCINNGCDCRKGFVYDNNIKACVKPEECTLTCKANEEYSPCINGGCGPKFCTQVGQQLNICPEPVKCIKGCVCVQGYLRASNGTCVTIEQCRQPPATTPAPTTKPTDKPSYPPICKKNEVYYNCSGECTPRKCSEIGYPLNCDEKCTPGCVCKDNYVRADNGTCIPIPECPSCGGDKNAVQGCSNYCGHTCSTYNKPPPPCPRFCNANGCDCRKGFVYDNNVKACVKPKDCTPTCKLNEEYSSCINGGCGPKNCSQVGQPDICVDPLTCDKGCVCVKGYLRASNGTCIPRDQCPPPQCPHNEVYDPCPPINCPPGKSCPQVCTPTCRCADGLIRCKDGRCAKPKNCHTTPPQCPDNEVYDPCPPINCPPGKSCPQVCTPTCRCADGLIRCKDGRCAKPKNCHTTPPQCPDNEVYDKCPPINCPPGKACAQVCTPTCRCADGLIRCKDGRCAKPENCQTKPPATTPAPTTDKPNYPPICKKNEVYYNCSGECTPRRCSEIGFPLNCDEKCTPGCVCKDDYVRADNGTCIPIPDCPSCGGDKNAHQGCSNYCSHTCSTYNKPPSLCPSFCLFNGCDCRKGFVYDNNVKACVKPEDCTPICQVNEEYSPCTNGGCDARNCSQIGKPVPCIKLDPNSCIKGCVCVKGYLRASNGTCVPKDQCKPSHQCPGQNEFFDTCISGCSNQTCETIGKIFHCPLLPAECRTGCRCNPGFYRNASNVCVSESQCPTPPCPEGEIYSRCPTVKCEGDYCAKDRNSPQTCPVGIVCDPPRCVCGLLDRRDRKTGKCIKAYDCPPFKCDGPNEEYQSCPATCPGEKCTDYINNTKCPPYKIGVVVPCRPQCRCKKGYYRNSDGICILASQCAPPQCPDNEVYDKCPPINCPPGKSCPQVCTPTCRCADGLIRCKDGRCAKPGNCQTTPPKCPDNEVYDKCPPIHCPPGKACAQFCTPTCRCADGLIRCKDGRCAKPENCQTTPQCPDNEVYDKCPPIHCPPGKACAQVCTPTCRCADGLIRCKDGRCAKPENCQTTPPQCPDNEVYDKCPPINCPPGNACAQVCTPTCRCADGLIRCKDGRCAKPDNCQTTPPQCPDNEVYDKCPPINCPPGKACAQVCTPTCRCADGLIRCKDGRCAKPENCHTKPPATTPAPTTQPTDKPIHPPRCGKNEMYKNCSDTSCRPYRCSELGFPLDCDKKCKPGCICKADYVRDDNGICIPIKNCPSCGGDKNAESGCGNNCGKTCASYKIQPPFCSQACVLNGCDCRDGFVYDPYLKSCVRPKDCTRSCKVNEEYSSCSNGGCGAKNCSQVGQPDICVDPVTCVKGCVCVKGYLRASNGTCVPTNKCPPPDCPNGEVWDSCPTVKCDGDNCPKTRNSPQTCPVGIVCDKPRCVCGYNRKRDRKTGKCIPITDCPPFKCDLNEEYQACPWSCPGEKCSDYTNKTECPPYDVKVSVNCRPACKCIKGYYRNADGKCVPACECPADSAVKKP